MSVEVVSAGEAIAGTAKVSSVRELASGVYSMWVAEPSPAKPPTAPSAPSAPVGCAMNGVTKTLIVVAGLNGKRERLRAALARTKATATMARKHGNQVHLVFLGGALPPHGARQEGVVEQLVEMAANGSSEHGVDAANVHLLVGAREIQALSMVRSDEADAALAKYLRASKFIECLGPAAMDASGAGGCWLKSTSTQGGSIVGKLPGVGVAGANGPRAEWIEPAEPLSLIAWKNKVNQRWAAVAADPQAVKRTNTGLWDFWMTVGVTSALEAEQMPSAGLESGLRQSVAVFARQTAAFGTVQRSLTVDRASRMILPGACWMDVGVRSDSLFWATQTWCFSTTKELRAHKLPMLDKTPSVDELQYDVSCTLGSLVQHKDQGDTLSPPTAPWANFGRMRGTLGPCVCAGRDGQEIMRVVHWVASGMPEVVMLLPEAYVRYVLQDYYNDMLGTRHSGSSAVSGFLVLDNSLIVPMRMPGMSEPEQADAHKIMGNRLWKYVPRNETGTGATAQMRAAPLQWRKLLQYKVAGAEEPELTPGARVGSDTERTLFYTHCTSSDPLAGLVVKWVFAPREDASQAHDLPTLDLANDQFETRV